MIGPRPDRGRQAGQSSARSSAGRAKSRSRSRSRRRNRVDETRSKAVDAKEKKEFAWMDSDDESSGCNRPKKGKSPASSGSESSESSKRSRPLSLVDVQTLGQMARLAPKLESRLKHGDVRSRELLDIVGALSRSKYFDAGLFENLAEELRRVFKRKTFSIQDILNTVCMLADLNAYNAKMFQAACDALLPDLSKMPDGDRSRLEAALKTVGHETGDGFGGALRKKQSRDRREACSMFWRGQCKWGPKCKLSHDQDSFDDSAQEGRWKPPTMSGGRSVGFKQSADLFKADRCGALW
eukprot:TRINITY_DN16828_c0_g1_i2.p1 TRINITY_DN16828_c0_g1~~TRINITY_DN16828_c0_g1_i2.p1  ORF type:complete len:296 (+),score=36.78 TRINITY_DN16828_c0_g1_i2:109-996(+)